MRDAIYFSLWLFIAIVSAIDTYLCVRYAESLVSMEQNPVCQWLLAVDGVPILTALKFLGTSIVLGILFALRRRCFRNYRRHRPLLFRCRAGRAGPRRSPEHLPVEAQQVAAQHQPDIGLAPAGAQQRRRDLR